MRLESSMPMCQPRQPNLSSPTHLTLPSLSLARAASPSRKLTIDFPSKIEYNETVVANVI